MEALDTYAFVPILEVIRSKYILSQLEMVESLEPSRNYKTLPNLCVLSFVLFWGVLLFMFEFYHVS